MKSIFGIVVIITGTLTGFLVYAFVGEISKTEVTLFFTDKQVLIDSDCSATKPVKRYIKKSKNIEDLTLKQLLNGVSQEEESEGLTDSFHKNSLSEKNLEDLEKYYRGITIKNKIATVDFDEPALAYLNSAACLQASVKSPIIKTLSEFESIDEVQFSIDGKLFTEWDA